MADRWLPSQTQFSRLQELIYELKVNQVMTRNVITVHPEQTMADVKELLRFHRISGMPVVADGSLAGIVSIEDVVRSLEQGRGSAAVAEYMSGPVVTVWEDDVVAQAVSKFSKHRYGRLPVVDRTGALVGIVTPGDIMGRMLKTMDAASQEAERRRPAQHYLFSDLPSEETRISLRYAVSNQDFSKAGEAAARLKRILQLFQVAPQIVRRVAIATYEAEMNLIIHSVGGVIDAELWQDRVIVLASDTGPGIADLDLAMQPGYSTAPAWVREFGFGAGMGLKNMRDCSDEFSIESCLGEGTRVQVTIYLREEARKGAAIEGQAAGGSETGQNGREA